jgi:hypothetical protein
VVILSYPLGAGTGGFYGDIKSARKSGGVVRKGIRNRECFFFG